MKRPVVLLALAALAVVPVGSQAKGQRAKVLRGTFEMVGADGAYIAGKFGKAHLVDNRRGRRDKLSVHVRRLAPRDTYIFRLEKAARACAEDAPGGTEVTGWRYRRGGRLRTNRKGHANSWARSRTFRAVPGTKYYVAVYTVTAAGEPDQLLLCAKLKGKRKSGKGKRGGDHRDRKHGSAWAHGRGGH
jgi:hypothetical protein